MIFGAHDVCFVGAFDQPLLRVLVCFSFVCGIGSGLQLAGVVSDLLFVDPSALVFA